MRNKSVTSKKNYWNSETDEAIKEFLLEVDMEKRELIFCDKIYPCFNKLAEVAASKYGPYLDREDAIIECISHLYKTLIKHISYEKKHTAYSYLTRAAFTYVMQQNNKKYNKGLSHTSIDVPIHSGDDENSFNVVDIELLKVNDNSLVPTEFDFDKNEFIKKLVERVEFEDIREVVRTMPKEKKNANDGFIRRKMMLALTYLGSNKFHKRLQKHKPYIHYLRDKDLHNVSRNEIDYLRFLKPIVEEIYSTK